MHHVSDTPARSSRPAGGALLALMAVLLCAGAAHAATPGQGARASVVSGTPATAAQFPYLASVMRGGEFICGGSLIAPDRVLTAAHCLTDLRVNRDRVRIGPTAVRRIAHVAQHPRQTALIAGGRSDDAVLPFDAGILQLAAPVTNVAPIRLAQPAEKALYAPSALLVTVGMGSTDREGNGSGPLRYAVVQARADADCTRLLRPLGAATDFVGQAMICTTDPDGAPPYRSSCYGDSGAPLIARAPDLALVQVGVDSWGVACGFRQGDPENYTEVPSIAAFALSPAPVYRPEPIGRPRILGVPKVGRPLRCTTPRYRPPRPDRIRYGFFALRGNSSRLLGTARSYRIGRSLRGARVTCAARARSAGGEITTVAWNIKRVR